MSQKHPLRQTALFLAAALITLSVARAALPAKIGDQPVPSLAPLIKQVAPAVVNIATRGTVDVRRGQNPLFNDPFFRHFFGAPEQQQQQEMRSLGSGVIVDAENGYILTNYHVVANADEIEITLQDDRTLRAEVIGADEGSDIAVLKVSEDRLTDIPIADSEQAQVGDYVIAIGNPFGLEHTVTSGIISGLGRSGLNPNGYEDFIQTDASINPGNSGGALVNLRGELVGINSAIFTARGGGGNIGIGFAIPSNMVSSIMDQILEFGEVRRGLLGVNIYTVTPDIAEAYGVEETRGALVSQVMAGSAAEAAGIETGDIIVLVGDKTVKSANELRNSIGLLRAGESVDLGLVRDGVKQFVTATLGERESSVQVAAAEIHRGLDGAEFENLDESSPEFTGILGVRVRSVERNSTAYAAGLRSDDVIIGVNRATVRNVEELREAAGDSASLVLNVRREDRSLLIPVR